MLLGHPLPFLHQERKGSFRLVPFIDSTSTYSYKPFWCINPWSDFLYYSGMNNNKGLPRNDCSCFAYLFRPALTQKMSLCYLHLSSSAGLHLPVLPGRTRPIAIAIWINPSYWAYLLTWQFMMNLDESNRLESANGRILAKQKNWGTLHMGSSKL